MKALFIEGETEKNANPPKLEENPSNPQTGKTQKQLNSLEPNTGQESTVRKGSGGHGPNLNSPRGTIRMSQETSHRNSGETWD